MNVLMVEPGEVPYAVDIGEGLEALQTAGRRGTFGCLPLSRTRVAPDL